MTKIERQIAEVLSEAPPAKISAENKRAIRALLRSIKGQ